MLSTTLVQFNATGVTSAQVSSSGQPATNFATITVTSSNPNIATAALVGNNHQFTVTSVAAGTATITVAAGSGGGGPATLTAQVQTTTIMPQSRRAAAGGTK